VDPLKTAEYGSVYNRLMRQNALVRWTHLVLGVVAAAIYESQRGLSHYAFWRSSGWAMIAILAVPVWPYAASCIVVWRRTTTDWARPWIFCFILVLITVLVSLWYLSESSRQNGIIGNLTVTIFQGAAFYYLAEWTFEDSWDDL
jgi:hypothetical protein